MKKPLITLVTGIAIGAAGATGYLLLNKPANPYAEGLTLMQKSKFEEAAKSFQKSLAANPENIAAQVGLASAHQSMGKEDEALKYYETANTAATGIFAQFYANLGALYQKKQDARAAQSAYEKLAAFQVKSVDSFYNQAMTSAAHGMGGEALGQFDKVLTMNPSHAAAAFQAGRVAEQMGNKKKAIEYYQTALRADADLTAAKDRLTALQGGSGKKSTRSLASKTEAAKPAVTKKKAKKN